MEIFKRRKGGHVKPLSTASDVDGCPNGPVTPQVAEEGEELFEDFLSSQMNENLPQLHDMVAERRFDCERPPKPKSEDFCQAAARLRHLATTFSQSDERQQVREVAMEISPDITGEELSYLLLTMFTNSDHVEEGIVVIFFFCFDLIARLVTSGLKTYWDIITLCKSAILSALGPKIQEQGGWSQSIQSATENTVVMSIMATGMLVVARLGLKALFDV